MDYVADTHALLWHLFDRRRLGTAARVVFQDADAGTARIYLPAVVVAEMIMVVQKGRLPGATMPQLLTQLNSIRTSANYILLPLLPETVIASHTLVVIPDIFDRLVVAEAQQRQVPLITRDPVIIGAKIVNIVWD